MHIHYEELTDVARYIENHSHITLEDQTPRLENVLKIIRRFRKLDSESRILEIGIGSGWFQIYCRRQGLRIHGLEISPQLIEVARNFGNRYEIELELELGNIEEAAIGKETHDVIVAASVFEHVEDWKDGIRTVFEALRPGGVFFFDSTNKFSLTSGEFDFPLYGWMPNKWRYRLRRARQGEDIMKHGIDFHQFTYPQLRRAFKEIGFSKVVDMVDSKDVRLFRNDQYWKSFLVQVLQRNRPLKHLFLTFAPATFFICVK
jgi:2-polyprenyl-3-methyl-5-hydroxy-6-metoxy-1,4-benzoquinol methylase